MSKKGVVDYNIEYAHIYTDEKFGRSQEKSVKVLQRFLKRLKNQKKSYSLVVLIDDYHPPKKSFSITKLIKKLEEFDVKPDFIAFESRLRAKKETFLDSFEIKKEAKKLNKYFKRKGKISCAFLICIWYLLRLGIIPDDKKLIRRVSDSKKPFIGKHVVTILPKKYKSVEEKVIEFLKKTKFKKATKRIKTKYY